MTSPGDIAVGLTRDEQIFAMRMLPHFLAGKSPERAAEAVLEDDNRLVNAALDGSYSFLGWNDATHRHEDHLSRSITSQISERVYLALRTPS